MLRRRARCNHDSRRWPTGLGACRMAADLFGEWRGCWGRRWCGRRKWLAVYAWERTARTWRWRSQSTLQWLWYPVCRTGTPRDRHDQKSTSQCICAVQSWSWCHRAVNQWDTASGRCISDTGRISSHLWWPPSPPGSRRRMSGNSWALWDRSMAACMHCSDEIHPTHAHPHLSLSPS